MNKLVLLLILFYSMNSWGKVPSWISNLEKSCPKTEICAVGVGRDLNQASAQGREELAKIFKVKVASDTFIKTRSEMTGTSEFIEGDIFEVSEKDISELTDVVLEGSFLKKSYAKNKTYALIVLNREDGARIIKGKIDTIDEKIENLYKEGRRGSIFKAIGFFIPREELNAKYDFLVRNKVPPRVSLKRLLELKKKFLDKKVTIYMASKGPARHKEIRDFFTSLLLKMGYRVVTSKSEKHNYSVDFYLDWKEQYLKVSGFVKYQYDLKLYSYNVVKIKIGNVSETITETGRNFNQCYRRAKNRFKKYLLENINDINLD
ncbi:MAG: hypothetical protein DRQ89_08025 [Epsilonproteobacteria bacterium]|nr:MAG: hypothetical protein DRQ89_08025 [Campylobacterota bacterium]